MVCEIVSGACGAPLVLAWRVSQRATLLRGADVSRSRRTSRGSHGRGRAGGSSLRACIPTRWVRTSSSNVDYAAQSASRSAIAECQELAWLSSTVSTSAVHGTVQGMRMLEPPGFMP